MSARTSGATAGRPSPFRVALPGPIQLEARPLPAEHGGGLDDGDGIRPAVPQAGQQDPEKVPHGERRVSSTADRPASVAPLRSRSSIGAFTMDRSECSASPVYAAAAPCPALRHEGVPPPGPHPGQPSSEEPITPAQLRPTRRSLVYDERPAQGEVLEGEVAGGHRRGMGRVEARGAAS
jgi:hypothetical protein